MLEDALYMPTKTKQQPKIEDSGSEFSRALAQCQNVFSYLPSYTTKALLLRKRFDGIHRRLSTLSDVVDGLKDK